MDKAGSRGADVLVLDLEDGVHPEQKEAARANLRAAYRSVDWGASEVFVRINALGTPWGEADRAMIRELAPTAVILPKAEDSAAVEVAAATMGDVPVLLMVETARGIVAVDELASSRGVSGLVFGAADFRASLSAGRLPDEQELAYARGRIVTAARACGIEAFDTPWFEYKDRAGLEASATRARLLGFDGKTAIHPGQVAPIHRAFTPTEQELARARRVVEVMETALARGDNVATLGDEMVEALHLDEARRLLSRADS